MFAIGEVREFATGFMESAPHPYMQGSYIARIQTIQKVWDGQCWLTASEGASIIRQLADVRTAA